MVARMLVVAAVALSLTACRGGGGNNDPATAVAPSARSTATTATASILPSPRATLSANATIPATPALPNTSLPAGCDEATIRGVIAAFIAAFNEGD